MKLKCLIVDDEELSRALLETYIDMIDFIDLVGSFENPLETLSLIKEENIDVVFLDIEMPEIKGTNFAKLINTHTQMLCLQLLAKNMRLKDLN